MQIICDNPHAAAHVLTILLATNLRPIQDFTIRLGASPLPALIFTMIATLTDSQCAEIRALPGTKISEQERTI